MTNLARVRVDLSGWIGGPGINTLYFSQGRLFTWDVSTVTALVGQVHDAWYACRGAMVTLVTFSTRPDVDIIDAATGEIQSVITSTDAPSDIGDASSNIESRATQATVAFRTDQYYDGRRLQGRIFFGPLGSNALDGNGFITSGVQTTLQDAFATLYTGTGARLAVYSRPVVASTGPPAVSARDGRYGDVTAAICREVPGTLRSRKN